MNLRSATPALAAALLFGASTPLAKLLVDNSVGVHTTPWGSAQQFVYCFCRLEH